jgi:hypothetical protein
LAEHLHHFLTIVHLQNDIAAVDQMIVVPCQETLLVEVSHDPARGR